MTPEEAIQRFYIAVRAAVMQDAATQAAVLDLHSVGLRLESFSVEAALIPVAKEVPKSNDKDFLRQLRIRPDLEVRE